MTAAAWLQEPGLQRGLGGPGAAAALQGGRAGQCADASRLQGQLSLCLQQRPVTNTCLDDFPKGLARQVTDFSGSPSLQSVLDAPSSTDLISVNDCAESDLVHERWTGTTASFSEGRQWPREPPPHPAVFPKPHEKHLKHAEEARCP